MTARPRKPWRVTVTGPGINDESSHTTETKAYDLVRNSFGDDSNAQEAKVDHWENGTWWWYETVTAEEIRTVQAADRTTEK